MDTMQDNRGESRVAASGGTLAEWTSASQRTWRRTGTAGLASLGLAMLALAGCRSDDGSEVKYEILKPSEWFAFNDNEDGDDSEPKTGVSGKTRGDIGVPPVPPAIDSHSPPPAPAPAPSASSNESYYGVRPTASRNAAPRRTPREPALRPIPRSY